MVFTSGAVAKPEIGNTPLAALEAAPSLDLKSEPATTAEVDAVDEKPVLVHTMQEPVSERPTGAPVIKSKTPMTQWSPTLRRSQTSESHDLGLPVVSPLEEAKGTADARGRA